MNKKNKILKIMKPSETELRTAKRQRRRSGGGIQETDSLPRMPHRQFEALHVRAAIAWPVSELRDGVGVSLVLPEAGLVSVVQLITRRSRSCRSSSRIVW